MVGAVPQLAVLRVACRVHPLLDKPAGACESWTGTKSVQDSSSGVQDQLAGFSDFINALP